MEKYCPRCGSFAYDLGDVVQCDFCGQFDKDSIKLLKEGKLDKDTILTIKEKSEIQDIFGLDFHTELF